MTAFRQKPKAGKRICLALFSKKPHWNKNPFFQMNWKKYILGWRK